ncbi:hypothetical protein MNBD_GAMMA11-2818 [hydrothermal vent metagenome]|uniref:Lipoprotein n=1 Tax=hydrothermal vent metagenome TaxID=652676 RepID=A0A3B0WQI6_9ZZZZ
MSSVRLAYSRKIMAIMCFLIIAGCNASEKSDLRDVLEKSFEDIYLAKHGMEYPYSKDRLNSCVKNNYKPCLNVYHRVIDAKNTIVSQVSGESQGIALGITLDIIESACLSKDENVANFICYGGIMSLYFYNSPEKDKYILSRLKKLPEKIRTLIFNSDFFWYYNRPNRDLWIRYIAVADVNWESDGRMKFVSDMFNKNISEVDGDPWVLR